MDSFHQYPLLVPQEAIDENGHANNVEYVRWMQQAAISHADAAGCTEATKKAGASWVVRSHHVEYLRPVFAGDQLAITTWVSTLRKSSSLRKYIFRRENAVVAQGETLWVFVDAQTGRPRAIPEDVFTAFILVSPENEPSG